MTTANIASFPGTHRLVEDVQVQAFKLASPIIRALMECEPGLRDAALELFEQLDSGELDPEQAYATTALIADILYPNADHRGAPELDLEEAESIASAIEPAAGSLLEEMDRQEATFAERLRELMKGQDVTQAELAQRVGIGQSAVSMMLNRKCRPQRKTVQRIASALGVAADALWPSGKGSE